MGPCEAVNECSGHSHDIYIHVYIYIYVCFILAVASQSVVIRRQAHGVQESDEEFDARWEAYFNRFVWSELFVSDTQELKVVRRPNLTKMPFL